MKFGNPICFSKGVSFVPLLSFPSSPYGAVPGLGEKKERTTTLYYFSFLSVHKMQIKDQES